ncbi:quinone-dependent dihydroorotate dehydrogenase [Robiginitomaculum antarcticum]|uniref:quinone-dependent dihydroorotate dehydrogenase n=1 Tax=Robiginitomaculum antarcticum TaxID=437507 RepID=UPI000363386D|nr:quinone-dependent dihydroorotate dehydrogenase [Robiginitomaculum antarcticum]
MSLFYDAGMRFARSLPAEAAHKFGLAAAARGLAPASDPARHAILATNLCGLSLPNPVGLAAGFDKDALVPDAMLRTGFGFVECGTVTPRPQEGNSKPRLFRLTEDKAVINRMGFNNDGLENFADKFAARHGRGGIVGANLGANKDSVDRAQDYIDGLTRLWGLADYFTINISSPNTPGLRDLQGETAMEDLLGRFQEARQNLAGDHKSAPVFLKVSPDLDNSAAERIVQQARLYGISAIIVSNTTISRPDGLKSEHRSEGGGLSGAPLKKRADFMLKEFAAASAGRIPLIGVGGISSGADAYAKIRAGASAVQLYSALVFEGPGLVSQICDDLAARLKADGFKSVTEAVGTT